MDVSHVLTETQRAAGLRLIEPDDHLLQLTLHGCQVEVYSQHVTIEAIKADADWWMEMKQPWEC